MKRVLSNRRLASALVLAVPVLTGLSVLIDPVGMRTKVEQLSFWAFLVLVLVFVVGLWRKPDFSPILVVPAGSGAVGDEDLSFVDDVTVGVRPHHVVRLRIRSADPGVAAQAGRAFAERIRNRVAAEYGRQPKVEVAVDPAAV